MKKLLTFLLMVLSPTMALGAHQIDVTEEIGCLVEAIYFEARGESTAGQVAVANVIMNRVKSRRFPNTICEVVNQPKQFSYTHEIKDKKYYDITAYRKAMKLAELVYFEAGVDLTDGATMYHHVSIHPKRWDFSRLNRTTTIDGHVFYYHR